MSMTEYMQGLLYAAVLGVAVILAGTPIVMTIVHDRNESAACAAKGGTRIQSKCVKLIEP